MSGHAPARPAEGDGAYKIPALRILSEITTTLSSESDIEALLERFLGTMIRLSGASAGAVRVLTADGEHLRLVGAIGLPPEVVERERYVDLRCGICGTAARGNNIHSETDLRICAERVSLEYFGEKCRKVIAVPLQYQGKVLGIYNLFMGDEREVPAEVSLLFRSISEHLGIALENARLTRENLRITLMNERQMMANEIHDSLAQTLAYMKMRLTLLQDVMHKGDDSLSLKYVADVSQALDSAYSSLRELLTHFRNRMDPHGLLNALQETVRNFHDKTGIHLDFVNKAPDLNLTVDQEVQVFHIVQEALANVVKHSRARHAQLRVEMEDDWYLVTIEDDGEGMRPGAKAWASKPGGEEMHFGLNIMRERAQALYGEVEIETMAGRGTRVLLSFPAGDRRRMGVI